MFSTVNFKSLLTVALSLFMYGCSNTFYHINNMLVESVVDLPGDNIPVNEINESPYSSIYVSIDNSPRAYVLLALAEAPQTIPSAPESKQTTELKWISSDAGMLVTRNGRLLKTLRLFNGNRVHLSSESPDPISQGLHLDSTPTQWESQIDWQPGYHFSYVQHSTFTFIADEEITINGSVKSLKRFDEHVSVPALATEYTNQFWIDADTGLVLRSRQKIAPNLSYIDITLLKPYSF